MKRSSSAELERAAKRPRLEVHTEEAQDTFTNVATAADIPSTHPAVITTDNAMDLTDESTTTIYDLPLEILGNHIFKFFDFEYWLKNFVTVSKAWQNAAVQSNVDKQLRVKSVFATCIINQYKVSTLIIKFEAHLHDIATLINASPRISSVKFNYEADLDSMLTPANISKFSFDNVSTLFLPSFPLKLLSFFPKVSKVCFKGHSFPDEFLLPNSRVQEVALQEGLFKHIKESLRKAKTFFPEVKTFYFAVTGREKDSEDKINEELATISNELGVSLIYHYNNADGLLFNFAYHEYFNHFGKTAFCRAVQSFNELQLVFKKYPTLTLEYEQDFTTRKRQFLFPRVALMTYKGCKFDSIPWDEITEALNLCYEKKMLPPRGMLHRYINQNNHQAAIEILKANNLHNEERIKEGRESLSLVQLSDVLGPETFKEKVDKEFFKDKILDAKSFEDLTPIKDLLSDEVLRYIYKALLQKMHNQRFSNVLFQYLILIDSWLHPDSSRRVGDQVCIGLQYLSDEAQAKYFKTLMKDKEYDKIMEVSHKASKPVNQLFHKGKTLLANVGNSSNLTEIVNKFNFDINQIDQKGKTILHYAIKQRYEELVVDLLQLGADPNLAANSLMPLHHSLSQKENFSFSIISALLTHGADINRRDFDIKGRTAWPITIALSHSAKAAKFLLHFGADPTVVDEAGNTLLHVLCRNGYYYDTCEDFSDTIRLLVPYIDINKRNNLGNSVLHCAILARFDKEITETLIQCGADINLPNIKGETPLLLACNHEDVLKSILATNRANIHARDKDGKTLVNYVFVDMQSTCAKLLQDEEFITICKPYLTEDNIQFLKEECKKEMPIYHLEELVLSHITIAKFLVELGYDVAAESYSLLNSIDPEKHSEVFNYLLAHGLNINAKIRVLEQRFLHTSMLEPFSPQLAKKIQFLINNGASVTEKNKKGVAPIDIDPLIETRYSNGFHVDYFLSSEDDDMPEVNLMELRQKMAKDK